MQQFQTMKNEGKVFQRGRKHCGIGEIARYEQFLLFPQCFQKICTADTKRPGIVWERVKYELVCYSCMPC